MVLTIFMVFARTITSTISRVRPKPGGALLIASAADAKGDTPARAYTEILFLPPRNLTQEKWTGPKLGAENPEAPKITGFDHVEDMGQLPDDVASYVTGAHPVLYTDVDSDGRDFCFVQAAGSS